MHAQQSFLNVCNTAILGYRGDKIIFNIKMSKISNMSKITGYSTIKYVKITDYLTMKICQHHR